MRINLLCIIVEPFNKFDIFSLIFIDSCRRRHQFVLLFQLRFAGDFLLGDMVDFFGDRNSMCIGFMTKACLSARVKISPQGAERHAVFLG